MLPSNLPTVIAYLVGKHENTLHNPILKPQHSEMLLFHPPATPLNDTSEQTCRQSGKRDTPKSRRKAPQIDYFPLGGSAHHAHAIKAPRGPENAKGEACAFCHTRRE